MHIAYMYLSSSSIAQISHTAMEQNIQRRKVWTGYLPPRKSYPALPKIQMKESENLAPLWYGIVQEGGPVCDISGNLVDFDNRCLAECKPGGGRFLVDGKCEEQPCDVICQFDVRSPHEFSLRFPENKTK